MSALTRKVCIVGEFAVGKTSTVARFVHQVFSEKYLTTVGVKIDTKELVLPDGHTVMKLVIWDVAGADRFSDVELAYVRGSAGCLLVADGTRARTLDTALRLGHEIVERYGPVPRVLLVNKHDLVDSWEIAPEKLESLRMHGIRVYETSAMTGRNVERAIADLAVEMVDA